MKYIASPLTTSYAVVNKNMMIFEMKKRKIVLNRPIQIGVTILEISKLIMYTYYFDVLKSSFGSRIKLLYTVGRSEHSKSSNIFPFRLDFFVTILGQVEKLVFNQI